MTRFDLEQQIVDCWQVTNDLGALFEEVCETEWGKLDQDMVSNILLGLQQLYDIRFKKLFSSFEALVESGDIK